MKAFEILRTLKGREKKEFDSVIKTQSRKTLRNLYDEMKKHLKTDAPPSKEVLFSKAFGRQYTADQDYLLRNELRLLATELEQYIARVEFQARCDTNPSFYKSFLFRAWRRRNMTGLISQNIEGWIEEAMYNWQYQVAHKLIGNYLSHIADTEMENTEKIRKIAYYKTLKKEALIREFMQEFRYCEEWDALLAAFTAGEPVIPAESIALDDDRAGDAWSRFFRLQTLGYSQNTEEQLRLMLAGLEELNTIEARAMFGHDEYSNHNLVVSKSTALERIAVLCMFLGRYDEGIRFFEENISYALDRKLVLVEVSYYNLLCAYTEVCRYSDAVQFYEDNRSIFEREFVRKYESLTLKAACHLFLREPEKAVQCIPPELRSLSAELNTEFRLVQAIAFYLYDRVEESCREMLNLERMIRHRDFWKVSGSEIDYHRLIDFYSRFFKAQTMLAEKRKEALGELRREVETFRDALAPMYRRHSFLSWLLS